MASTATVVKHTGSHYLLSPLPRWEPFEAVLRGQMRLQSGTSTNPIAVGDRVEYEPCEQGPCAITKVLERKNHLIRKSVNLSRQNHIIAANIDRAFVVTSLYFPEVKLPFLDRILLTCEMFGIPATILLNKTDLAPVTTEEALREELDRYGLSSLPVLPVSVTGGSGLGQAEDKIIEIVYGGRLSVSEGLTITSVRQKNLLVQAAGSLEKVSTSIEMNMPEDFLTIDLMDACDALGAITGEQAGEDLINEIFSKFCMGK